MSTKISAINQDRVILLIFLVLIAFPFLVDFEIPLEINSGTIAFYDTLLSIPEGGSVLWCGDVGFILSNEIGSGEIAIYKTLFTLVKEKNVKLVLMSTSNEGIAIQERYLETEIKPNGFTDGLTYGEDWVFLGFLPGGEAAMAAIATDIKGALYTDWYGNLISELPIMDDLHTLDDFDLVGWGGYYIDEYGRQWTGYNTTLITNISTWGVGAAMPWFAEGLIGGFLNGGRGCAEFETLSGYVGFASKSMNAQSLNHLYAILLLIIVNIYYLTKVGGFTRWRGGEV